MHQVCQMHTLQIWCRLCRLGATRPLFVPFWQHRPDCAQTLQSSGPFPKLTGSKVWVPFIYSSTYHLAAKKALQNSQLEQGSCQPTKISGRRSGPAAPRPCWLTFHVSGGACCTFGSPQDRLIDLPFWGFGGHVHHLPQNRLSQRLSSGPKTVLTGLPHYVVSRLQLKFNSDLGELALHKSSIVCKHSAQSESSTEASEPSSSYCTGVYPPNYAWSSCFSTSLSSEKQLARMMTDLHWTGVHIWDLRHSR